MFIDGHKQSDVVKDYKNFLKKIEELKPYKIQFEEDGIIKAKTYLSDCAVGGPNQHPIIVITHDECTFSTNNGIQKA